MAQSRSLTAVAALALWLATGVVSTTTGRHRTPSARGGDGTLVQTTSGPVQGAVVQAPDGTPVRVWRGIPYATAGRWEAPVAPTPWTQPLQALTDGPACLQDGAAGAQNEATACLVVNVFAPSLNASGGALLPVLVWIHGGDYVAGSIAGAQVDASAMVAEHPVVVVALQYRLGVSGALALPPPSAIAGNFMLADQRTALEWVSANAAGFGGDRARVTLFGQSAGGMSVAAHLASPLSAGLFAQAIVHSDPFAFQYRQPSEAAAYGQEVATAANCSFPDVRETEACLRALPPAALLAVQDAVGYDPLSNVFTRILYTVATWSPTAGTADLPLDPLQAIHTRGAYFADVTTMIGTVAGEMDGLLYDVVSFPVSPLEYDAALEVIFGVGSPAAASVLAAYPSNSSAPCANGTDCRQLVCDVGTPFMFLCAGRNATLSLAARPGRNTPAFRYRYDHVSSFAAEYFPNPQCWPLGSGPGQSPQGGNVCHSAELWALFSPDPTWAVQPTPQEAAMAATMRAAWASFAATGSPAVPGTGLAQWAPVTAGSAPIALLNVPADMVVQDGSVDGAVCAMWDSVGYSGFY